MTTKKYNAKQFWLTPEQIEYIKKISTKKDVSESKFLRDLLQRKIEKINQK